MRTFAAVALGSLLALGCARPGPVAIRQGAAYGIYKGDRKVMIIRNAPGKLASTALLPPGQEAP